MMFTNSPPFNRRFKRTQRSAALQLGLLDQVAILVRQQMALDLGDRVHRHVDHDQQAGAAQEQGHLPVC
jgi:hypothetical protein